MRICDPVFCTKAQKVCNKFEMNIKLVVIILTFEGISNFSSQYELSAVHLSLLVVGTSLNRTDKESMNNAYVYCPIVW